MNAPRTNLNLTLFDLDHTLIPFDSDYAWGEFTMARGWTDPADFKQKNDAFYAQYQAGSLDIHEYVRFTTSALVAQGLAAGEAAQADFMRDVVQRQIVPAALDLLRSHQASGDTVVIITATNAFVTRPIADALGVEELVAVDLERGPGGWYTGAIQGIPSFREGKVQRMNEWLTQRGLDWGAVNSTFYSDSINDLPLLERVNHPVATNPDGRLRAVAEARGWRILDLFA